MGVSIRRRSARNHLSAHISFLVVILGHREGGGIIVWLLVWVDYESHECALSGDKTSILAALQGIIDTALLNTLSLDYSSICIWDENSVQQNWRTVR